MGNTFKVGLNQDQINVFNSLENFCKKTNTKQLCCIQGYAGTGKTFTLTRFFSYLKSKSKSVRIVMSAPTNKAVGVLKTHTPKEFSSKIDFETIHKLLGVKPEITIDGEEIFVQKLKPTIKDFNFVIIDEVSMLDDELFFSILKSIEGNKTKIIFMGDPKQIPPINKTECEPFLNPTKYDIEMLYLKKIMRQADGNKIIDASYHVRENIESKNIGKELVSFQKEGQFDIYNTINEEEKLKLKSVFEDKFCKENFENSKVIAWRNAKVSNYNHFIRGLINNKKPSELPQIIEGELLISNSPIFDIVDSVKKTVVANNVEMKVIKYTSDFHSFPLPKAPKAKSVKKEIIDYYLTQVSYFDYSTEKEVILEIKIIKEDSKEKFNKLLDKWSNKAKKSDISQRKMLWRVFYDIKEHFANVSYAYALTAHKSQGSTYKNVFVDVSDISFNHKVIERNRIIYTAITRASNEVKIIIN